MERVEARRYGKPGPSAADGPRSRPGTNVFAGGVVRAPLALAALVVLAVFSIQGTRNASRPHGSDATCYFDAGADALRGADPYAADATFEYVYPPSFAVMVSPMALLPTTVAALLWSLLALAALLASFWWLRRGSLGLDARPIGRADLIPLALMAAALLRPIQSDLANGQVNLMVVGLVVAFLAAQERDRALGAGSVLALAVHTKLLPVLLLAPAAIERRGRVLAASLLGICALALLPALAWGTDFVQVYGDWLAQIEDKLGSSTVDGGAFTRSSHGGVEYFTLRGALASSWPSSARLPLAGPICMAVVLGATAACNVVLVRRGRGPHASRTAAALWLLAALLVSPMSEKHHLVLLLPSLVLATYATLGPRAPRPREGAAWTGLIAALALSSKLAPQGPSNFLAIVTTFAFAVRTGLLDPRGTARRGTVRGKPGAS